MINCCSKIYLWLL